MRSMQEPSTNATAGTEGRVISFWMRHEEIEALRTDAQAHGEKVNTALRRLVREGADA